MTFPSLISPVDAHAARNADPSIVYLDVRTPEEFAAGHAPSAINIPILFMSPATGRSANPLFLEACRKFVPQDVPIIVGCLSGNRSMQAITIMRGEGWTQLANLVGGFLGGPGLAGWTQCNLPVAKDGTTWDSVRTQAGL